MKTPPEARQWIWLTAARRRSWTPLLGENPEDAAGDNGTRQMITFNRTRLIVLVDYMDEIKKSAC